MLKHSNNNKKLFVFAIDFLPFQKLLSVDPQDLAGTMTSIVTITRGEHVKRHYSKLQAEGRLPICNYNLQASITAAVGDINHIFFVIIQRK